MAEKREFDDLTVDADTKLLSRKKVKIHDIEFVHENWEWDGVFGNSAIFYTDDVKSMSDDELKKFVSPLLKEAGSEVTIKRKEKYTFTNFNFEMAD